MKTFSEAISLVDATKRSQKEISALEQRHDSLVDEIMEHPDAIALVRTLIFILDKERTPDILADLQCSFMAALSIGVTIGIEMEKP